MELVSRSGCKYIRIAQCDAERILPLALCERRTGAGHRLRLRIRIAAAACSYCYPFCCFADIFGIMTIFTARNYCNAATGVYCLVGTVV